MKVTDDEIEFASLFSTRAYSAETRTEKRLKAERRSQMSDRQISRGGRVRDVQMNFRTTAATKALAAKLADKLGASLAEAIELAISELASRNGVSPDA